MMDSMIIGKYVPGTSLVHRLDPRTKLITIFEILKIAVLTEKKFGITVSAVKNYSGKSWMKFMKKRNSLWKAHFGFKFRHWTKD